MRATLNLMKRSTGKLFFVLIGLVCVAPLNALDMMAGEWELVVKQDIGGMPMGNPAVYYRECLRAESPIPKVFLAAQSCDVTYQHTRYHTVLWKMNCMTDNGTVYNEGSITYQNLKISGQSRSAAGDVLGRNTTVRYSFTGRRIGECAP